MVNYSKKKTKQDESQSKSPISKNDKKVDSNEKNVFWKLKKEMENQKNKETHRILKIFLKIKNAYEISNVNKITDINEQNDINEIFFT